VLIAATSEVTESPTSAADADSTNKGIDCSWARPRPIGQLSSALVLATMKKRKLPKKTVRSDPIGDDVDVEMLYAAAEAHPNWEVMPDGTGIRHLGSEAPNNPRELLEWFLKKGRH
jgi:hypothetical protein